jgi:hypothetical protein
MLLLELLRKNICINILLTVSEHRVIRRIFGPKSEEPVGGWRRLHDEELHNFYTHHILLGRSNQGE